jgi:hypothetical protein
MDRTIAALADEKPVTTLQEARSRLEELMPEVFRTLNNWSLEPSWERAAGDWTAVLSEFLNREATYRGMLEERVLDLEERLSRLEGAAGTRAAA